MVNLVLFSFADIIFFLISLWARLPCPGSSSNGLQLFFFHNFSQPLQVSLPVESVTGTCFLQHYIESILALQDASCRQGQGIFIFLDSWMMY